ncbi:MAG: hypothetical protein M3N54_12795 [Acidobacteriota bacterium]|nr:hypothetical protein [Acidobacteriota bacterium]
MKLLIVFLTAVAAFGAEPARIRFSKSFPGSTPAYVAISVDQTGAAEYKEDPADENPLKFQMSEADAAAMFAISERMEHFAHPLESGLKVANMGMKTFRYEGDGGPHEAKFNYSEDLDARNLLDWFERISESERALIDLERAVRFDKLGAYDAILRLETIRDQKRLVAEQQFLPLLDRVVKSESYLHMARARAAMLTEAIRAAK